jgi:4-cresol dehydrogenase (hydroxylating)
VIREAARNRTPLWPVSGGRNWGYGSHLPARDGCVVLDLGSLASIGDLDRPSLSVRIEPGVTQATLHEFLRLNAPDLAFNVTGSGRQTSVLGNALDRGIGYCGEKDQEVYAFEVLLPDGSLIGPVSGRNHKARTHPAGPSTDALFFQSNFGVVVGARLRLRIRQQAEDAVVLQGPLDKLIAALKAAYDENLISHPTHVSEPGRTQRLGFGLLRNLWQRDPSPAEVNRCFPEHNSYNGLVPLYGRRKVVNAAWSEMCRLAGPGVKLRRADAQRLAGAAKWLALAGARSQSARLLALRPLLALVWGEPSDVGLASLDAYREGDPDLAKRGAVYGNAVSSVSADEAKRTSAIVGKHWKDCAFTWIILDSRCMITIYTLHFDDAQTSDVHAANGSIVEELRDMGLPPYRHGINIPAAAGAEDVTRRLKAAFDPMGIISPGRYET